MRRPLQEKTAVELGQFVDRNKHNKAELQLALDELRRRKTVNAKLVQQRAEKYLRELNKIGQGRQKANRGSATSARNGEHEGHSPPGAGMNDLVSPADEKPSTSPEERRWTDEAIASLRKKLIDLSKKNPLINFRHSSRGASHLRIVDERPDLIYEHLLESSFGFDPLPDEEVTPADEQTPDFRIAYERARITDEEFLAATEKLGENEGDARAWQEAERALRARVRKQLGLPEINYGKNLDVKALALAHGFNPSFDLENSDGDDLAAHHEDDKLRVLLTRKELEKRLKTIWDRYRSHQRETGLHTLCLVLGFVQWHEDDSSDLPLYAPLLLLPVQLDRRVRYGRYEFRLTGTDENVEINIALIEKLRQLGLELPDLRNEETPESYFIRVEGVLEKGRRLSLRRFATLAVLPFPRMVLWKDLDPGKWTDGAFAEHPLLPILVRAKATGGTPSMGLTFDIDNPQIASRAPPLVQPADASQHSALIDVVEGKSIAIEGPPGTGKSQTITNMIAAAVKDGKRVLFVAEKQAALKVVADRLRHAGLGPLLLELHSDGADRTNFYNSLREWHAAKGKIRSDVAALDLARKELAHKRDLIRRYLSLISTSLGARNRSAHWLAWRQIRLQERVRRESIDAVAGKWQPEAPGELSEAATNDARTRLDTFASALAATDAEAAQGERTAWCEAAKLDPFQQQAQLAAAKAAAEAAAELDQVTTAMRASIDVDFPGVGCDLDGAVDQLRGLTSFGAIEEQVAQAALRKAEATRALLARQTRWRQICSRLEADLKTPASVSVDAVETLVRALDALNEVPDNASEIDRRLSLARQVIAAVQDLQEEISAILKGLSLPETIALRDLHSILTALSNLEGQPPSVRGFYRAELLDDVTLLSVEQERAAASALAAARLDLLNQVDPECFEREPDELEHLAGVIEGTGFVGRIFGRDYRSAKKLVGRLIRAPLSDRTVGAALIRNAARNLRQYREFRHDSCAASIVSAPLWRGVETDWTSQEAASQVLREAADVLATGVCSRTLMRWLELSPRDRTQIATAARALLQCLSDAEELGLGTVPIPSFREELAGLEKRYSRIQSALQGVGTKSNALINRDGESLNDRLEAMLSAEEDFNGLKDADELGWIGSIADPLDELARALAHRDELVATSGPLEIADALALSSNPVAQLDALIAVRENYARAVARWKSCEDALVALAGLPISRLRPPTESWSEFGDRLLSLSKDEAGARLAADLLRYRRGLDEIGCGPIAEAALAGEVSPDELADLYELLTIRAVLREFLGGDGAELAMLGGLTLQSARDAFVRIDKQLQELEAAAIVAARLDDKPPYGIDRGPKSGWTELALLENELGLRRPRTPLRDITVRAGKALQTMKPVWMMSPTSAAQYIQPGSLTFDLLIVDEASQMRPEFAVSALMRANQFIVVGDANQLPPTDFFTAGTDEDEELDAAEGEAEKLKVDTESILDLANQRFRVRRRLKWHYRSQHESLIQFSNRQFYQRDLIVFPSPVTNDELLGVKYTYVGGTYEASVNEAEAKAVIEEAFRLMRSYPQRSIGIATMNAKQTELIKNEFDRLVLEAPEVRRYVDNYAGTIEEFFIKNLENVQGDERDIILISTVYGPDKNGVVMQRFGPMNREVGWRRLNVLVTRAKLSTRLFTSLRPEDIKITPTSNRGLIEFKNYLTYAANGAQHDDAFGGEPDSDFELFVADAVRAAGYEAVPQVGVEGFRIDIGVRHPDFPLGFIAGIECDGATYHSEMTIRDRDRIRQTVLEEMGWNIYRVWSTDWFADPSRELAKLLARLDAWREELAVEYAERAIPVFDEAPTAASVEQAPATAAGEGTPEPPSPTAEQRELEERDLEEAEDEGPTGRLIRTIDGVDLREVRKGHSYHVWKDEVLLGSIEVLSRAMMAPRVYGGQVQIAHSEYEGRIQGTGERFVLNDIYACVREIAQRAITQVE